MSVKKIVFLVMLISILISGVAILPTSAAPAAFPTSRDPLLWPFAANSIWNMPIHNNAVYVPAGIGNHMPIEAGPTTDQDIIILSPNSPLKPIKESNAAFDGKDRCATQNLTGATLANAPIPANWSTGGGPDGNMSGAVLLADGVTVLEGQPLHVCSNGGLVTSWWMTTAGYNIKTNDGRVNEEGSHGGTGMTALGGSIRAGELMPGSVIRHALKMNFYAKYVYSWTGGGYRWPAPYADSYASARDWGGSVPAMREGSLVALKPNFNVAGLQTEPARIIAKAMQDYGAYAVDDTAWDVFAVMTEWGPNGNTMDEVQAQYGIMMADGPMLNCTDTSASCKYSQDWWTILQALHVVDNNSPTTIGGGPNSDTTNRRAPMAPPFIGSGPTNTPVPPTNTAVPPTNTPIGPTPTKTNTPVPTTWTIVDDKATGWTWSGWTQYNDAACQGGTARGGMASGSYGQRTFTGTGVEVYAWKGPDGGTIRIEIDGVSQGTFSLQNGTDVYKRLIFSKTNLASGSHTIKIISTVGGSTWEMVDYIRTK